jgi:peptidoglycan/xylan/chitin deacetylase (PgdA/CDA1 family)
MRSLSKRRIFISLIAGFLIAGFTLAAFLRRIYVAPVLMYHAITPLARPNNRLEITPVAFERQMRFLKKHKYNVIPLEKLAELIREKKKIPPRSLAITLDDGYRDNFTYAFPILKKYNLPATVFPIFREIGRPQQDRLSWEEIKTMQDSGLVTFGSHALGPEPLVNIKSEGSLKSEIFDSRKLLEEKLGKEVACFSYPEGMFNAHIRQLVKDAGYKLAVTTSPGRKFADNDIFALKRLRISANCGNLFIFWFESSGIYTFIKEKRDDD